MEKPHIFLDLDQTVICAEASEEFDAKKHKEKMGMFVYHNMDGYYIVFERNNLQEFLDYLFENFNVSVWTAASKSYALFIIEKIILQKPKRQLNLILFSYHCDISQDKNKGSKDLLALRDTFNVEGLNHDNMLIVDDYDEVYNTQKENCIIARPFEFTDEGSEKDAYLKELTELLKTQFQTDKLQDSVNKINGKLKG